MESQRKILIVDDSWDDRYILSRALRKTGLPVQTFEVEDGAEAIEFLGHTGRFGDAAAFPRPDMIFLDLKMPGRNGFDVLRWLQEHPLAQPIKTIALSGSEAEVDIRQAVELGADSYLMKPAAVETLKKLISSVFDPPSQRQPIALTATVPVGLSEPQQDTLAELFNSGFGQAAGALRKRTGHPVLLETSGVAAYPLDKVAALFGPAFDGPVGIVHQVFTGPICGSALLLAGRNAAPVFRSLLGDNGIFGPEDAWGESAREAFSEVGNILLHACIEVLSNLAQVQVTFATPRLQGASLDVILRSISIRDQEIQCAVVVQTRFRLRDTNLPVYLVIVLGMSSYARLLRRLEETKTWEDLNVIGPGSKA